MPIPRGRTRPGVTSPRDIICASVVEWGRMPYWRWRCLFREAVRAGHRVLWVDGLCLNEMMPEGGHRLPPGPTRLRPVEPGIHLLTGRLGRNPARAIGRAAAKLGFRDVMLWAASPFSSELLGRVGERLSVYDCADDYQLLVGPDPFLREVEVLSRVDLVIACTPALANGRRAFARQLVAIANGVDDAHFGAAAKPGPIPAAIATLRRPLVAYQGAIYDRIDWPLVAAVAGRAAEMSFVFAGTVGQVPPAAVLELPNVHFAGSWDYEDVPTLYRASDAAWLPHRTIELTARQSSLKVLEYLAAGLPTVITEISPEADVAGVATVTRGAEEMLDAIRRSIAENSDRRRRARQAVASRRSWRARWAETEAAIEGLAP